MAAETRFSAIPQQLTSRKGVLLLLAQGLLIRAIFANGIAVNGDTGLYLYDAQQLRWGRTMFAEFPSRSPLVEYLLAATLHVTDFLAGSPIVFARGLIIAISVLVGAAVYLFATEVTDDKRVGIIALGFWMLTPFTVAWGVWVKTEQFAALFALVGLTLAVRELKREAKPRLRIAAVLGLIFAAGLLSRRVLIVHIGVLGLWILAYRNGAAIRDTATAYTRAFRAAVTGRDLPSVPEPIARDLGYTVLIGVVMLASMTAALMAAFMVIARGDAQLAARMADSYFLDLVRSDGFGSHGYLPLRDVAGGYMNHQYAQSGGPWWTAFCQKCGGRTLLVFQHTIMITLPVLLVLLVWVRAFTDVGKWWYVRAAYPIILVTLAVFAAIRAYNPAAPLNLLPFAVIAAMVIVVWRLPVPSLNDLYSPRVGLVMAVPVMLAVSYLYRDRILYPTYFQDFYPFIAVLAAIAAVGVWDTAGETLGSPLAARHWVMKAAAIVFVIALYTSATWAYPYVGDEHRDTQTDWFTMNRVQAFGDDVDRRLEGDETVFTGNPLYVIESEHRQAADLSRKYYLFEGWPTTPVTHREATELKGIMRSGSAPMAVVNDETRTVLAANASVNQTFDQHYCGVDDPLYEVMENTTLYVHRDHADTGELPACGEAVERKPALMRQL